MPLDTDQVLVTRLITYSQIEKLLQLSRCLVGVLHAVTDGALVLVDLVIIAALVRLITEEVDRRVVDATRQVLLILDVLQAVRLVPASWEDIKGDLTTNGVPVPSISTVAVMVDQSIEHTLHLGLEIPS